MKAIIAFSLLFFFGCKSNQPTSAQDNEWNLGVYHGKLGLDYRGLPVSATSTLRIKSHVDLYNEDSVTGDFFSTADATVYHFLCIKSKTNPLIICNLKPPIDWTFYCALSGDSAYMIINKDWFPRQLMDTLTK